jgi:hypothetical protein
VVDEKQIFFSSLPELSFWTLSHIKLPEPLRNCPGSLQQKDTQAKQQKRSAYFSSVIGDVSAISDHATRPWNISGIAPSAIGAPKAAPRSISTHKKNFSMRRIVASTGDGDEIGDRPHSQALAAPV